MPSLSIPTLILSTLLVLSSGIAQFASANPTTLHSIARRQAATTPTTCNGQSDFCSRSYGNITFLGTHNSYAIGTSLADNQYHNISAQLDDGIRMLQVQAHSLNGDIHLCHSSCSLKDGGSLTSYLGTVKTWLDKNPNEVISILIVNINSLPASQFATAFTNAGLQSGYIYTPPSAVTSRSAWPTLGDMIASQGRVVVFMDYQADHAAVPWIIDEFSNMYEDAYDVTSPDWTCAVNRTSGSPSTTLALHNHFLDTVQSIFGITSFLPNTAALNVTNSEESILAGATNCLNENGAYPNFILLDYANSNGNAPFNAVATLNAVPNPTNVVTPPTTSASPTGNNQAKTTSTDLATSAATFTFVAGRTELVLMNAVVTLGLSLGLGAVVGL